MTISLKLGNFNRVFCFELIELRLVASTQTVIGFELIELKLVASTQIEISLELIELRLSYINSNKKWL
ncbi:hypothetical protein CAR_c15110 [Carnobacterium sp. 17-4]|nr:hypothetical protein CAR_c15110 [Carnobacterium sp. 17-4]